MREARGTEDFSTYRGKPPADWRASGRLAWLVVAVAALTLLAVATYLLLTSIDAQTFG